MLLNLEQMERYQIRMRQIQSLKVEHPLLRANSEPLARMAWGATSDAWGAFLWHVLYGRKRGHTRSQARPK